MQHDKIITTTNISLKELISLSENLYKSKKRNTEIWKKQLQLEITSLQNLNINTLITFINTLHSIYKFDDSNSLKEDIDSFANFNPIIERVNFNLEQEFYKKIKCLSNDKFDKALFDAMLKKFYIINEFTHELRSIFITLLENHIISSECMSKSYKNTLNKILKNIKFKYSNNRITINNSPIEIEEYIKNNIINEYLNSLIDELIKTILSYNDESLENDIVYAKVMAYQTLLRSLLILLDNYKLLSEYEELYNKLEIKDTIAKNIIKSAFISNYSDLSLYNKKKIKENVYE